MTYQEMLITAMEELADAQRLSQFSANGTTISKQTLAALQSHIEWLQKMIARTSAINTTGFITVINL